MIKKVLGMGASAMDTVISCPFLPKEDAFQVVEHEEILPGGSCANMLVALNALGTPAQLLAKIGDDERGQLFRKTLRADGIEDNLLLVKAGGTTLHTYIWAAADGQHCIFVNLGDSLMELQPEEIDEAVLDGIDLFYADFFPGAATAAMAQRCRQRGIPVVLCMQCTPSFMRMAGNTDEQINTALTLADLIISGRDGYCEWSGISDYQQALAAVYRQYHPRFGAVCTAGSTGAIWLQEEQTFSAKAYSITPIDSTGAGDSFLGALIHAYFSEEKTPQEALNFASAVGAMKCLRFGPRIKVTPDEVLAFMAEHQS